MSLKWTGSLQRMFFHSDGSSNPSTRVSSLPTAAFLYLGAEVLVAASIGFLLATLALIKRALPKPPRDLTNDRVVVTGAGSGLGKAVAEEFFKAGCIVASIDQNLSFRKEEAASDTISQYQRIQELEPQNDFYQVSTQRNAFAYKCDAARREEIFEVAEKLHKDFGHVDVLITCAGDSNQNILDTVSTNLMSHYWTMLAFIPFMIRRKQSRIIAVVPASSSQDAYMASKAAVAGLVEAIGQQFSNANQLTFTMMTPKVESRLTSQSEQQTARDIVNAVKRDQYSLTTNWGSHVLYSVCSTIYDAITRFTEWLYRQGCDDLT